MSSPFPSALRPTSTLSSARPSSRHPPSPSARPPPSVVHSSSTLRPPLHLNLARPPPSPLPDLLPHPPPHLHPPHLPHPPPHLCPPFRPNVSLRPPPPVESLPPPASLSSPYDHFSSFHLVRHSCLKPTCLWPSLCLLSVSLVSPVFFRAERRVYCRLVLIVAIFRSPPCSPLLVFTHIVHKGSYIPILIL